MAASARQRFLEYVRHGDSRRVVSPFLPHPDVVSQTLAYLGLSADGDYIENEIRLSKALDYEPMFMTDCSGLIFPWQFDEARSDEECEGYVLPTARGEWVRRVSRRLGVWGDESGFPVRTEEDHSMLLSVCEQIGERKSQIREYYRWWRERVGEDGVIVLGHPNPTWLGFQIGQQNAFLHMADFEDTYRRSVDAVYRASLLVMEIAIEEGIDFMSNCSYGLEITSRRLYESLDMPVLQAYADWTHERNELFWYHNCGHTSRLIADGLFNRLGADVIETIAPPASGDNDLSESRARIDSAVCTKGNLDLGLLRDGSPEQVASATRDIVEAVGRHRHIISSADAVLPGTPPENFVAFIRTARDSQNA